MRASRIPWASRDNKLGILILGLDESIEVTRVEDGSVLTIESDHLDDNAVKHISQRIEKVLGKKVLVIGIPVSEDKEPTFSPEST